MPYVTKDLSAQMSNGGWRPHCYKCGRFIGVGGWYELDEETGEEGYSTCAKHTTYRFVPATDGGKEG